QAERLGLDPAHDPDRLADRWTRVLGRPRAPNRLVRPAYRLAEVTPFEGVRGGAAIPGERPQGLPASLEMLPQEPRLALACALEPLPREAVAEPSILIGEHRIRGIAHQALAEAVLVLVGERGDRQPLD